MNKANQHWLTLTPSSHNVGRVPIESRMLTWPSPSISGIIEMAGMTSITNFRYFKIGRVQSTYIRTYIVQSQVLGTAGSPSTVVLSIIGMGMVPIAS